MIEVVVVDDEKTNNNESKVRGANGLK